MDKVNLDLSKTKPLFAQNTGVVLRTSVVKNNKGGETKTVLSELVFLDQNTTPIARIILTHATTINFTRMMVEHVKAMEKESKRKGLPKQPKVETTSESDEGRGLAG